MEMEAPELLIVTGESSYAVQDHQRVAPACDWRTPGSLGSMVAPAEGLTRRRLRPSSAMREANRSFSGGPGGRTKTVKMSERKGRLKESSAMARILCSPGVGL